jgi:hypothetical protein
MEAPPAFEANSNINTKGQNATEYIKPENSSFNELIKDYEILEDKTEKKYTYFLETHLENEDTSIVINVDPKNKNVISLVQIYHKVIDDNKNYVYNVYRITTKDLDMTNKNIELNIYLRKDKTDFESKHSIDLHKNNFLGLIKFKNYKGWLGTYKAPLYFELSQFQIINILNEALLINEKIKSTNIIFYDFIDYGLNLYNKCSQNKLELYLLLYINIINGNYDLLIEKIFELFEINERNINYNYIYLSKYKNELDNFYRNQNNIIEKFLFCINNNIFTKNLEFYLKRFYTIYIYVLHLTKEYEKIENIFKDLLDNKYDNLILSKLYLSTCHSFYKKLLISNEIKLRLINKLIDSSENYHKLLLAFSLISEYVNKDFVKILEIICQNYGKINDLCFGGKIQITIEDYINQKSNDDLNKIEEYLKILLTNKKRIQFSPLHFSNDIFFYFIEINNNSKFISFLENILIETSISVKDLQQYLTFSSKIRNNDIILVLELIINKFEIFNSICEKQNEYFSLSDYIKQNPKDDLIKLKNLISIIVEKQKSVYYNCIEINIELFKLYSENNDFEYLKLLQSIINIIKTIDKLDEESIDLPYKIHNAGIKLIKEGKMDNEKLILFLKEDEMLYNEKKICDLVTITDFLNKENNLRKEQCMLLENENKLRKEQIENLKKEISYLKNSNEYLVSKIDSLKLDNEKLHSKINSLFNQINRNEEKIE